MSNPSLVISVLKSRTNSSFVVTGLREQHAATNISKHLILKACVSQFRQHECVLWYVGSMSATNRLGFTHVLSACFPSIRQFHRAEGRRSICRYCSCTYTATTPYFNITHPHNRLNDPQTFLHEVYRWQSQLSPAYRDFLRQTDRPIWTIAN